MEKIHLSCECGRNETDGFMLDCYTGKHRQTELTHTFVIYECESCGYEFHTVTDE